MRNNHRLDAAIRRDPEISGRAAYEASLQAAPTYHDGSLRPIWAQLSDLAKWSWGRKPEANLEAVARETRRV
jgi:hypothetical protein